MYGGFAFVMISNFPFMSVEVASDVPFNKTDAPIIVSLEISSRIIPLIFCAWARMEVNKINIKIPINLFCKHQMKYFLCTLS